MKSLTLLLVGSLSLTLGCQAKPPDIGMKPMDMGMAVMELAVPVLSMVPMVTPKTTVAVRGSTDGKRVVVQGGPTSISGQVLPSGTFCIDVPLTAATENALSVFALSGDGRISQPAMATVTQDDTANVPDNPVCNNQPPICSEVETCDNGIDDNCDGWSDTCDTQCNGCSEDGYAPNQYPINVPTMVAGSYPLSLCPCRDDWFVFNLLANTTVDIEVDYQQSDAFDIDIKLFSEADALAMKFDAPVAKSEASTGLEQISYAVATGGNYYLRVYNYNPGSGAFGEYTLSVH